MKQSKKYRIEHIKSATKESQPYFFDGNTLRMFCQTLSSFKVFEHEGRTFIAAKGHLGGKKAVGMPGHTFGPIHGLTVREFTGDDLVDVEGFDHAGKTTGDFVAWVEAGNLQPVAAV